MRTKTITFLALLLVVLMATGCDFSKSSNNNEITKTETKDEGTVQMGERTDVLGTYDFNGDGKKESCYLLAPKLVEEEMECEGDCNSLIMFSDSNIPPIEVPNCIGGTPEIFGDLDGNGTCEIGIWPEWWTSCWHAYYIFTFTNGTWSHFVDSFTVHCNLMDELEETGESIIEAVPGKNDMFKIRYSEFDEVEGTVTKTAIVKKSF